MIKEHPDHHDAELVLRLYDLRREAVMRQSRDAMLQFLPRTWEELSAVMQLGHPQNAAWRQVSSYWEMAYGFARHGVVNPDFLVEGSAEGLVLYAKVLPHLERMRKELSPTAFQNCEWLVKNSAVARQRLELIQGRIKKMAEAR
ncbi:MAG: hypothetical protein HZA53_15405 [Planctomycetes bacterium]|nr:hypothetical protein [Planctomycetota bacterium]